MHTGFSDMPRSSSMPVWLCPGALVSVFSRVCAAATALSSAAGRTSDLKHIQPFPRPSTDILRNNDSASPHQGTWGIWLRQFKICIHRHRDWSPGNTYLRHVTFIASQLLLNLVTANCRSETAANPILL
ncbi:uncharacterized protein EI97DRAFT_251494 [Westerdykella ornata]|uniref:Secreted protein n=1 Tax=Westerdykella ornata TaxID=318751 RepID=A0A6A6JNZ5_WESOR|nr:uncharacterized protein EI97DRAFT_251494 [Westerdykella ornata]KAF2278370.1 hypothetical protein EI97DRAFT_251494 [Westerdykella ornata]